MKNIYACRDDFYYTRTNAAIDDDLANLRKHRVRYTNDTRSLLEPRIMFRAPSFVASGSSSSLVNMGSTITGRRVGAHGING